MRTGSAVPLSCLCVGSAGPARYDAHQMTETKCLKSGSLCGPSTDEHPLAPAALDRDARDRTLGLRHSRL